MPATVAPRGPRGVRSKRGSRSRAHQADNSIRREFAASLHVAAGPRVGEQVALRETGRSGRRSTCEMPVIQALPRIAGTIASRSPTFVSATIRPSNVEPMRRACVIASPTPIRPRAWSAAMPRRQARARRGAIESSGGDDDRVLRHRADAPPRLCDLHDAHSRDVRVLRMRARQLLARGKADQLADARELARLLRLDREAERGRVGDRVPHAAEGDVHRERAQARRPRAARRAARRSTGRSSARRSRPSVAHAARTSTTPPGASRRSVVSGSCSSTIPVSSSTVATQIVFEPDIAGYSVGSMMM